MTYEEFVKRLERRQEEPFILQFSESGEMLLTLQAEDSDGLTRDRELYGYYSKKKSSRKTDWSKAKCRTIARNVLK